MSQSLNFGIQPGSYMFEGLNRKEEKFAEKLLKGGIALANLSLSKFINSPILINMITTGIFNLSEAQFKPNSQGEAMLIKTDLMGDMDGINYLVFTKSELEKLYIACLGEDYHQSPQSQIMTEGLLTEVSNVMVSSFITEIADTLGLEMYPNVPSLQCMDSSDIDEFIHNNSGKLTKMIYVNAKLQGKELDITPDFIWILHENLLDNIREEVVV